MKKIILLLSMMFLLVMTAGAQKREMRGAWIQCVNGQFPRGSNVSTDSSREWVLQRCNRR